MIKIINIENDEKSEILTRDIKLESGVEAIVADIIKNVRENGDKALKEYSLKFDGADIKNLRVTQEEIDAAYENEDKALIETLEMAKANIWNFHEKQLRKGFEINNGDGTVSGQKITPIEKVGIYVPGGTASYPSTVLMNAIPAKIAGCPEVVMVTPPGSDGKINPVILAAASIAGQQNWLAGRSSCGCLLWGPRKI